MYGLTGISVITVTHNSSFILADYLRHLHDGIGTDDEIILVDSGSLDLTATTEIARSFGIEVASTGANVGFGAGTNFGAKLARGDWLAIVNPDVEVSFSDLRSLVAIAESKGVTCLGPEVVNEDGNRVSSVHPSMRPPWRCKGMRLHRSNGLTFGESISGCCTVMRKSDFDRLGGFDEYFFMFTEEIDLHRRIWEQGGRVGMSSDVSVRTPGGASSSSTTARWSITERDVAHVRYFRKNFSAVEGAVDLVWRSLRTLAMPHYKPRLTSLRQLWLGVFRSK